MRSFWMVWLLVPCLAVTNPACGDRLIGQLPRDGGGPGDAKDGSANGGIDTSDGGTDLPSDANAADRPTEVPALPVVCTAERWCWTHPLPTGDRFVQATGLGADDLWLLGGSGVILRRSGGV